jgi:YidC/Oxa1 family membrane protein insertase
VDIRRIGLLLATSVVGLILWTKWNQEYPTSISNTPVHSAASVSLSGASSQAPGGGGGAPGSTVADGHDAGSVSNQLVNIKTDVFNLKIDSLRGTVAEADLLKFTKSIENKEPMPIGYPIKPGDVYHIENRLFRSVDGSPVPVNLTYTADHSSYQMLRGQKTMDVHFTAKTPSLTVIRTLHFTKGSYAIQVTTQVKNNSTKAWRGFFKDSILRSQPKHSNTFNGASYSSDSSDYAKLSYKNMDKHDLDINSKSGWIAMQQHYFLSAIIPQNNREKKNFFTQALSSNDLYRIGYHTPYFRAEPGMSYSNKTTLYIGPEDTAKLAKLATNLNLTVNYGWFSSISKLLFSIMKAIHGVVGNWGWTIIFITIFIKALLYYPSAKSYQTMARMKEFSPRMKILQERHKDDRQALSQATMELYKAEKLNPLGGCLPILIQIPIFIALYHLLSAAVELRQAPFVFWIHDLSVMDPYWVLPILMGLSMLLQQKLSPSPPDPTQAKVMMILPIAMTAFFIHFPAGLVLYWLTNNLVSIAQQFYIMKTFDPKEAAKKARYKKKKQRA